MYIGITHGFLAVGHQCGPYATHGQLDARDGVVLVAVEPRDEGREVGGQLLLCLRRNGGETKRCTLCVHGVCVCMCPACVTSVTPYHRIDSHDCLSHVTWFIAPPPLSYINNNPAFSVTIHSRISLLPVTCLFSHSLFQIM